MLDSYKRQIIAQTICSFDGYVTGFRSHGISMYMDWLRRYTTASYIINTLQNTNQSMGKVTADFIMNGESSSVISFIRRIIINLRQYSYILDSRGDYERCIIDDKIRKLNKIIYPISNTFPTKNLFNIKQQTKDRSINNSIDELFISFKRVSEFSSTNNKEKLGNAYKHIIQYSELLLLNTFNYILNQYHKDIGNNIGKREKAVCNLLYINKFNKKTNKKSSHKKRNNEKSKKGIDSILNGLQDIIKKFSRKSRIVNGVNEITDGLATLRSTTSDVHTQTVIPTKEEVILSLNVSSTLTRFLLYRLFECKNK